MRKSLAFITLLAGSVQALEFKTEPLGTLKVGGAVTLYGMHTSNRVGADKENRYDVGSALLNLSKAPKPLGFNLTAGAYGLPVVGVGINRTWDSTGLFSALPVAYLEYAPTKELSLQAGKLPTIIGYESAFTYTNNHIQRGLVWNMQPVVSNCLRLTYKTDLFSIKLGVNDGFYTLSTKEPKMALEGSLTITPTKKGSVSFNFILPDKGSRPNPTATPANKREFNIVTSYTLGKESLGFDFVYVEAPTDARAQVPAKARAGGGAVHLSYELKPFKATGRVEYVKDSSDVGGIDLVGLGDGNKGWTFTFTHSYTKGALFLRWELSYVKANNSFTLNNKKSQTRAGVEAGLVF